MHDQTTPLFSQSGEMLSFSRGGGTSSNTTNKYIYTRAYEKTTKRALFLSLVLSLFLLLLLLLLRARVFPLNKYVVTLGKDENSFLLLSNARSRDENTPKRAKDTNPRILRHSHEREIRHTREISFSRRMLCFFEKKRPKDKNGSTRDPSATFDAHFFFWASLLREGKCAHFSHPQPCAGEYTLLALALGNDAFAFAVFGREKKKAKTL